MANPATTNVRPVSKAVSPSFPNGAPSRSRDEVQAEREGRKYCEDCRFYIAGTSIAYARCEKTTRLIEAGAEYVAREGAMVSDFCTAERRNKDRCGPAGKNWEPKE